MAVEPKFLPLVEPIGTRYQSLTVDSRLVNGVAEKGEAAGELYVYRRPGFKIVSTLTAGTARGLYNWRGNIYAIIGTTLYKNGANVGTVVGTGAYSFSSCLGATPKLFMQNGTNAYTITTADVFAAVTDGDYPASTVGGTVYLDGTTYVFDSSANVFGSDGAANDPSAWDPLNIIVAQIESTMGIYLAKQLVYVLALKTGYTEVFYDAGNATASPLGAVQGAKINFGCIDGRTVRDVGGDLIWVADSGEGFYSVVMVSGLKAEVISTPAIERILSGGTAGAWSSWNARIEGHRFYGVTNTTSNFTLVFDITSKIWYQWTDVSGNYLPYHFSCQGSGATVNFLHGTNGKIYTLDMGQYIDEGDSAFACDIYTPNFDGGTRRVKTLGRMDIVGDQVATNVAMQFSDDDYATWVTGAGFTVDMSLDRPSIADLGSFTKRAFRFTHQANSKFRFKAVELYLDIGDS